MWYEIATLVLLGIAVFGIFGYGTFETHKRSKVTGYRAEFEFMLFFFLLLASLYTILVTLYIGGMFGWF